MIQATMPVEYRGTHALTKLKQQPDAGIAARITKARQASGLTQQEAAQKLGVEPSHVSHMETRRRGVSLRMIKKMAGVYGVDPRYLLTGKSADELASDPDIAQVVAYMTELSPRERERLRTRVQQWVEDIRLAGGDGSAAGAPGQ